MYLWVILMGSTIENTLQGLCLPGVTFLMHRKGLTQSTEEQPTWETGGLDFMVLPYGLGKYVLPFWASATKWKKGKTGWVLISNYVSL